MTAPDSTNQDQRPADSLAPKLAPAHVGLRADLEVHRHVFRGEPSYIIRDPVTLAVHRVSAEDYQIVAALDNTRPLGDIFGGLVEAELLGADDEEGFYRFILSMHSLGFLSLPVPDDKSLYERRLKKQRAKRTAKLMGFLFCQIPVWNPDAFLAKTSHMVAWAFSRWALAVWCVVVGAAAVLLFQNREEFFQPLGTIFTPLRLVGLWFTLVGMKVLHEFGHAYTCRLRGGEVPEMGVFLIAGTPCAYVDATSSWGFTRKSDRIAVIMAGVYVELFIAALAIFVWATASTAELKIVAFDIVLVAGVATIIANLNPLMRFDGYYLFSDMLEIPNLRSTAQRYTASLIRWVAVGTKPIDLPYGRGVKAGLAVFGVAGAVYKFTIVMGISALLATKALWLGIGLAVFYAGGELVKLLRATGKYLIHSDDAAERRVRTGVLAFSVYAILPAVLLFVPVPRQVKATAAVGREIETVEYPALGGFVESVDASVGSTLDAGMPIVRVQNDEVASLLAEAVASVERSSIRALAALGGDRAVAIRHEHEADASRMKVDYERGREHAAVIRARHAGVVVDAIDSGDIGRYVSPAMPIATIADGRWVVRAMVRAEGFASLALVEGDEIRFRAADQPGKTYVGRITRVTPAGSRDLAETAFSTAAGGDIPISPVTGQANEAYFEVEAMLSDSDGLDYGMTGRVSLGAHAEPLARTAWRAALRLLQKFEQG